MGGLRLILAMGRLRLVMAKGALRLVPDRFNGSLLGEDSAGTADSVGEIV